MMKKLWSLITGQKSEHPQVTQNNMLLKHLRKMGDKLIKGREVYHWVYFKTAEDRKTFFTEVSTKGFALQNEAFIDDANEYPYSIQISRIDQVDSESVNDYTMYLYRTALEHNGDYDGWETSVETD